MPIYTFATFASKINKLERKKSKKFHKQKKVQAITLTFNSFFLHEKSKWSTLKSLTFASYWGSPLVQFSKFKNFLWVCWFLGKNLSNFVPPVWKLHSQYCHNGSIQILPFQTVNKSIYKCRSPKIPLSVILYPPSRLSLELSWPLWFQWS